MKSHTTISHLPGRLFVLSGPSGVGKDAVLSRMRELYSGRRHFTITATTRAIRPGETDGVDYIFLTEDRFRNMIAEDGLLEWAEVHGNLYGVPRKQVTDALERGLDVIMKIDVQGAAAIRKINRHAILIFLAPPDIETLETRLRLRNTESKADFQLRLETALSENQKSRDFNHKVINHTDALDQAAADIDQIIRTSPSPSPTWTDPILVTTGFQEISGKAQSTP